MPSSRKARVCDRPAEIFTTRLNPAGTLVRPSAALPHATTVPSARRATRCEDPALRATTFVAAAGT